MPSVKHYPSSEVNQKDLTTKLLSLTENTSYTLTQINGQRIYKKAPHAWNGPQPHRNCEVFIGRIPHDCFEDTLVPLFRQAGELFEFRLMINFSGWNRGYAFAMYTTEEEAYNAIRMFNNYMIRPAWHLGVCASINNCRIFISRIPMTMTSAEIVRMLYALTDDVKDIRIRRSLNSYSIIVEYHTHRSAAMARKTLVAAAAATWGCGIRPSVDWSLPQSPQLMRQYREVGRWSPERGVELMRVDEMLAPADNGSQAHRLRMIHAAQRNAYAAHAPRAAGNPTEANGWFNQSYDADSLLSSMMSLCMSSSDANVWGAPDLPAGVSAGAYAGTSAGTYAGTSASAYAETSTGTYAGSYTGASAGSNAGTPTGAYADASAGTSAGNSSQHFNPWTTKYPNDSFILPPKDEE